MGTKKQTIILGKKYNLDNQFLHAHKICFNGLTNLSYLNGKEFEAKSPFILNKIEKECLKC